MKNIRLLMRCCVILMIGIILTSLLKSGVAQEKEKKDRSLLAFVDGNPTKHEIVEKIMQVLKNNVEKAKERYEWWKGFIVVADIRPWEKVVYESSLTKSNYQQKLIELFQWQFETAQESMIREEAATNLKDVFDKQLETAAELTQAGGDSRKIGIIFPYEYVDCETMQDQTALAQKQFLLATNPTEQDVIHKQITQLLESNIEKSWNIFDNIHEEMRSRDPSVRGVYDLFCAEFYSLQKNTELLHWQYKMANDDDTRKKVKWNLDRQYEKQLKSAKYLVDLSHELKHDFPVSEYLRRETMLDQTDLDKWKFRRAENKNRSYEFNSNTDVISRMLVKQLEKAQSICEDYEKEHRKDLETKRSPPRTTAVGQNQTKYYFLQKQVELYRWQFENAKEPDARQEFTKKLMDVYKEQWTTAKVLAEAGREAWDIGMITMKDYLDCEAKLDRTTVDMLKFMLQTAE